MSAVMAGAGEFIALYAALREIAGQSQIRRPTR